MRRFERAARACQKRHAEWKDIERRRARLRELADEAARAAALEDLPAARKQFAAIRREWHDLGAGMISDPAVTARYADAQTRVRRARRGRARSRIRRRAARRWPARSSSSAASKRWPRAPISRSRRASARSRTSAPRSARVPQLPSKKDYDEIVKRLKAAQTALMPKVQELRDVADWQRWANVGIQEQLCEKMEALKAVEDPEEIAKQVRDAPGAVAAGRRRAARAGRSAVEALQDRARRGVDALRGALRGAGRSARRQPREEGRAVRARRGARRLDQLDPDRRRDQEAAGRVEDDRPGEPRPGESRSGSASAAPAIASSPAATPISPSARRSGPRTSRRRKRCA